MIIAMTEVSECGPPNISLWMANGENITPMAMPRGRLRDYVSMNK